MLDPPPLEEWLPTSLYWWNGRFGTTPVSHALWLIAVGIAMILPVLPLDWWRQFRLESRFGFNTTTMGGWVVDRVKGMALGVGLGFPLLWIVLRLVDWAGPTWWLWAWGPRAIGSPRLPRRVVFALPREGLRYRPRAIGLGATLLIPLGA